MDFIYLLRVLLKRKWIIIGSAIVAAVLVYFFTQNQKKQYKSSARFSTGYTRTDDISIKDETTNSYFEAENKFNNDIVTIESQGVINLLSYKLILHDLGEPEPLHKLTEEQKQSQVYKQLDMEHAKKIFREKLDNMTSLNSSIPEEKNLLELLKLYGYDFKTINKKLAVYRYEHSDYLQIDYISDHPVLSAQVVNDVFQMFMRYNKNLRGTYSKEAIDTLRSIRDKTKYDFDMKVLSARSRGLSIDVDGATTATLGTVGDLEKSVSGEIAKKNQNEVDLQKVKLRLANLAKSSTDNQPDGSNNDEIIRARNAANEAYDEYLKDPSNTALNDKYIRLKKVYLDLARSSGSSTQTSTTIKSVDKDALLNEKVSLELDIQANNRTINNLQGQINVLRGRVNSFSSQSQDAETMRNEIKMAQDEYLQANQKFNDATNVTGSALNNYKQVLFGQPALEPEPSKRMMLIGFAGIAAMITTMLVIIFLTYLDSSIKTPLVFSKSVNLKLMSMVNFMDLKNKSLADIVANKDTSDNSHDRTKFNAFRESIRKLRYEIESTGKKVFLFTSTKKGQGKTTLIQALSYSMSLSKKKILIIDTNFCNNDLTVQLHANPILEKIIPQKLNGKTLVDQVKGYSKDIGEGTIYAIGSEGGDYTPSEILPRENLLHHLNSLTSEFDYIFLEGPPLNDFSDSKELAQYVEGVIAVFSAQHIIKQIDKQSIGFFKELNGKFCGSILNMVDLKNVNVI